MGVVLVIVQGGCSGRLVRRFGERSPDPLRDRPDGPRADPAAAVAPLAAAGEPAACSPSGKGIHNPSSLGLLSRLTDESSQGSTIGLSRSFGALARTLGPAAGTFLFGAAGAAWPFWAAGGLMLVALVVAVGVLRQVTVAVY